MNLSRRKFFSVPLAVPAVVAGVKAAETQPLHAGSPDAVVPSGRRISADPRDPGYRFWMECLADGRKVTITLDGEDVGHVVTADEAEGFVEMHGITATGNLVVNKFSGGLLTQQMYGRVRIEVGPATKFPA